MSNTRAIIDRLSAILGCDNDSALAKQLDVGRTTLSSWISRDSPPFATCVDIAERENISMDWLLTGRGAKEVRESRMAGPAVLDKESSVLKSADVGAFGARNMPVQDGSATLLGASDPDARPDQVQEESIAYDEGLRDRLADYVLVPHYDVRASSGPGSALVENEQVVDHLAFRKGWVRGTMGLDPAHLALIEAIGDSMEPAIRAGDLLLVDLVHRTVRDDAVYVLRRDGALIAKRCQWLASGEIRIGSDNLSYQAETISARRLGDIDLIGRVVWAGRRM